MMGEEQKNRNWAMGCHLAALALYIGIPFGNVLGPLLIWLLKKEDIALVDEQGKEALNFQISLLLYGVLVLALIVVLSLTIIFIPLAVTIGTLFLMVFGLINLILIIIAAIKVSNGESFRYPCNMRLIK